MYPGANRQPRRLRLTVSRGPKQFLRHANGHPCVGTQVREEEPNHLVTDQFVDNEARLTILEKNQAKFEDIMDRATNVQDILQVQREIFNLQSQIDGIKGQQNYLSKTAQMAKITIFVSTDELALPYSPAEPWRPEAIFKRAVRSLVGTMQGLGTAVIWLAVYSVVWAPALGIFWYLKNRWGNKVVQK